MSETATVLSCAHCGLPVPPALAPEGDAPAFCCHGCRAVHDLLRSSGLGGYYVLRERFEGTAAAPPADAAGTAAFDDPAFHALHMRREREGGPASIDLAVPGVRCVACVWLLERLPRLAPGVLRVEVDRARSRMRLEFDPARARLSEVAALCARLGYEVHPARGRDLAAARAREDRALLVRVGVAGAAAANVMLVAMALYSGLLSDMRPADARFFRWISLALTAPAVLFAGSIFFRGALASLRTGVLHLDLPIAIGLGAGLAWGAVNTALDHGEVYFDSLAVLTFLLLVGRYLAQRGRRRAVDASEMLSSLQPAFARLEEEGSTREVPLEALRAGQVVRVPPGEIVPADGVIVEGASALDTAFLTGESRPVPCGRGDAIAAGAQNLDAPLRVRVERTGEESRAGSLLARVEELSRRRASVLLWIDRISGRFVAAVMAVAAASFAWWALARGEPGRGLECALGVLVVTCPCALGMATPLAIHAALGRAARRGIYARGGDVVQALGTARGGRIWLDKTGTLTEGKARLRSRRGDEALLPLAATLEASSTHPLAKALVRDAGAVAPREVREVRETRGRGVEGLVGGARVVAGAPAFVRSRAAVPVEMEEALAATLAEGSTPVLVAVDGRAGLVLGFADAVRPEAAAAVRALRGLGFSVGILSGDDPAVVTRVAAEVGVAPADALGGATPERKAKVVESGPRPAVMVGDGVNDAPAFAAANVGIAVHGAAEAGVAAADAFLCRPGLHGVVALVEGARATMRVVRRNLLLSLGYNVIGATLAATGLLHPLVGAVLMPFSSLSIVGSSYRARTFGGEPWR